MRANIQKVKSNPIILLYVIFIVALYFRIFHLGDTPFGLHNDEVANTYGAKYILLNRYDIYKNTFPVLYLDKFGDYPPILPMYLSGLGALIFGNNEFGSRFFIAIIGSLIVFPMYSLASQIFRRKETALFTAFIVAIAPWHIALSRLNAEGIVALTAFMFGFDFLFRSIQKEKMRPLIISFGFFMLTYFLYPSFRIIVPLTLMPIFFLQKNYRLISKKNIILIAIPIVALLFTIWMSSQPWGKGRFEQTSFVSPVSGIQLKLQTLIFNEDSIFVARIFNNKLIGYGKEFLFQYSRYFSFNYIFGEDGVPKMYITPYVGLLYTSLLPLMLVSTFGFIQQQNKNISKKHIFFLLYALLISPIPAALTVIDVPSIQRAVLTPALLIFVAAYGFNGLLSIKVKKIPVLTVFFMVLGLELIFFYHNYFQHISYFTTIDRNPGNKEVVEYIIQHQSKYDAIYVTNEELWLPTYFLYYSDNYDSNLAGKFKENFRIYNVDNVYFPDDSCPAASTIQHTNDAKKLSVPKKSLFIHKIGCNLMNISGASQMFRPIKTLKRLDETEVFNIVEINPEFQIPQSTSESKPNNSL